MKTETSLASATHKAAVFGFIYFHQIQVQINYSLTLEQLKCQNQYFHIFFVFSE